MAQIANQPFAVVLGASCCGLLKSFAAEKVQPMAEIIVNGQILEAQ
jgi:hypothetical protein